MRCRHASLRAVHVDSLPNLAWRISALGPDPILQSAVYITPYPVVCNKPFSMEDARYTFLERVRRKAISFLC